MFTISFFSPILSDHSGAPWWALQEAATPRFETPCSRILPLPRHPVPPVETLPVLNLRTKATNEKWGHLLSPEGLCCRHWMMKWAQLELHIVSLQDREKNKKKRDGAALANSGSSELDNLAHPPLIHWKNPDCVFQIRTHRFLCGLSVLSSALLLLN